MEQIANLRKDLKVLANPKKVIQFQRFFKTGKGEYGYGDVFIGLTVPQSRSIAAKYQDLSLSDIEQLLKSKIHEERLIALIILVSQFKKGNEELRKRIYDFYMSHTMYINNWDLVDTSAGYIVGEYLFLSFKSQAPSNKKDFEILRQLAKSDLIWERRIAMISTLAWIIKGESEPTLRIAEILLHDRHDLIQKAVGWMLREVGKRCSEEEEEKFLKKHYKTMPRTMLRYAIERFPEEMRRKYLTGSL